MNAAHLDSRPPLWRLVWGEVRQDFIPLRASALAFQTLASWLPLLAITLAVLSGPAFEHQRERILDRLAIALVPPVPETRAREETGPVLPPEPSPLGTMAQTQSEMQEQFKQKFRDTIHLMATNLGAISTFSFIALLVVAGLLYRTAEDTFNAIWKVRSGRSIFMKIAIVTVFIFWGPVFFFLSLSLTDGAPVSVLGRYIVPILLTAVGFTAFYMIMPNAKVRFSAALTGGIFGAIMWELGKQGFLIYVSYAVGLSKVYGSLGLVPIIFAWVYLSWVVILAGAELAYIVQHHRAMVEQWEVRQREARGLAVVMDQAQREASQLPALALTALSEIVRVFRDGSKPGGTRLSDLAECLNVETGPLSRALDRLVEGGLLVQVAEQRMELGAQDRRYLPARDPGQCSMGLILRACRGADLPAASGDAWERTRALLARVEREGLPSVEALTLAEWVELPKRAPALATDNNVKPSASEAQPGPTTTT